VGEVLAVQGVTVLVVAERVVIGQVLITNYLAGEAALNLKY
jgi:hypothetical protein